MCYPLLQIKIRIKTEKNSPSYNYIKKNIVSFPLSSKIIKLIWEFSISNIMWYNILTLYNDQIK